MRTPFLASCLVLLAACGGGGGGGSPPPPPPGPVTVDLPALLALSGWGSDLGGGAISAGTDPVYVGDLPDNISEARAILSFAIGSIPSNAAVTAAELRVVQSAVLGTPYTDFASLDVESVSIGADLDAPDLFTAALSSVGSLAPFSAALDTKTMDVLQALIADRIAGRTVTSLRLRFAGVPNVDGVSDRAGFALPSGDPTQLPVLRVTYQQ